MVKIKLTLKQYNAIVETISRDAGFGNEEIGIFFNKFILCEVLARKLIEYALNKKEQKYLITDVKNAIKYLFDENTLKSEIEYIFPGGTGIRNKKSPRQIRNGYLHNLSNEDKEELINNYEVYIIKMDSFINFFKNLKFN